MTSGIVRGGGGEGENERKKVNDKDKEAGVIVFRGLMI